MSKHSEPGQSKNTSIQRWYDRDIHLSELVAILESLNDECQTLFAFLITFYCDEIVKLKGRTFFRNLEWKKLKDIYKSRNGRRWYDNQSVLHVAFNKLYSLADEDKAQIARKLHVPAKLVAKYEIYCKERQRGMDLDEVQAILATVFKDGPEKALEIYSVFDGLEGNEATP